jgi:osmotically-inducible protein OsmY
MGAYYETFAAPYALTRIGPPIPAPQSDEQLEAAVEQRLGTLAGVVDLSQIEIRVAHGVVSLQGTVPSAQIKTAVVSFADNTLGVRGVEDQLSVSKV